MSTKRHVISAGPIFSDANFDHLVKVVFVKFLQSKGIFLAFQLINNLGRRSETYKVLDYPANSHSVVYYPLTILTQINYSYDGCYKMVIF